MFPVANASCYRSVYCLLTCYSHCQMPREQDLTISMRSNVQERTNTFGSCMHNVRAPLHIKSYTVYLFVELSRMAKRKTAKVLGYYFYIALNSNYLTRLRTTSQVLIQNCDLKTQRCLELWICNGRATQLLRTFEYIC
jgi:hypothetical protein